MGNTREIPDFNAREAVKEIYPQNDGDNYAADIWVSGAARQEQEDSQMMLEAADLLSKFTQRAIELEQQQLTHSVDLIDWLHENQFDYDNYGKGKVWVSNLKIHGSRTKSFSSEQLSELFMESRRKPSEHTPTDPHTNTEAQ